MYFTRKAKFIISFLVIISMLLCILQAKSQNVYADGQTQADVTQSTESGTQNQDAAVQTSDSSTQVQTDTPESINSDPTQTQLRYYEYIKQYSDAPYAAGSIDLPFSDAYFSDSADKPEISIPDQASGLQAVLSKSDNSISWEFNVPETALYAINITYFTTSGSDTAVKRDIFIDGAKPFYECTSVMLQRMWKDNTDHAYDKNGNEIMPDQIEIFKWQTNYIRDLSGLLSGPIYFYLEKGKHTINLAGVQDDVWINDIKLQAESQPETYSQVSSSYTTDGLLPPGGVNDVYQAEDASFKSDSTVTAQNDRTSPINSPNSLTCRLLNTMGGGTWKLPGQYVAYTVTVPKDGLYNISVREKQNFASGQFSARKITVNGQVPFAELSEYRFPYQSDWQAVTLGDKNGNFLIHLNKGENTIAFEVTLGQLSDVLEAAQSVVLQLNSAYRKIIMLTGTNPDPLRDYRIQAVMPDVISNMTDQAQALEQIDSLLMKLNGSDGAANGTLRTLSVQLKNFVKSPDTIPGRLDNFLTNTEALSEWILSMKQMPLLLDTITVSSPDQKLPKGEAGFFRRAWYEIQSFFYSFFIDYNDIQTADKNSRSITVWIQAGRDQAEILRNLITGSFTKDSNIQVNLQLVQGQLLLATAAGRGPDVALLSANNDPVNFASRGAALDLSKMPGFDDVAKEFRTSAMVPYAYQGGYYALPATQWMPMLFVRTDIFNELGLHTPQTWDDVLSLTNDLENKNLEFGVPVSSSPAMAWLNMLCYGMFLQQNGGQFYTNDGTASDLDSKEAIAAFEQWTDMFLYYKLPVDYNAANRFRTGQMPVLISDLSFYNTLSVFAPEIDGLWDMYPIPGIKKADGTIDRSEPSYGQCSFISSSTKDPEASWEFLKWFMSEDIQTQFASNIESLLGVSARWMSANIQAFDSVPWDADERTAMDEQWPWVKGIPEVPGGYFTGRHLENAFRDVLYKNTDPRETLLDYVDVINKEIIYKRQEFGLEVAK